MTTERILCSVAIGCFCLLFCFSGTAVQSQSSDFFRLQAERLSCIVEYSSRYLSGGELIAIVVDDCGPDAEPADLLSVLTNEVPPVSELEDGIDRYIVVTREDFTCLGSQSIPEGAEYVRYYPFDCRVDAE
jgi:hypothetical protein